MASLLDGTDPGYHANTDTWQWHHCWPALTRGIRLTPTHVTLASVLAGTDPGYHVNIDKWQWHHCWLALTRGIRSTVDTRDSGISVGRLTPTYWHARGPTVNSTLHPTLKSSLSHWRSRYDDHGYGYTEGASLSHLVNQKTLTRVTVH